MPHTENVQEFVERLGNFYEVVDDDTAIAQMVRNANPKNINSASHARSSSPELTDKEGPVSTSNGLGQHGGREASGYSSSDSTGSSPRRVSPTTSLGNCCWVIWVIVQWLAFWFWFNYSNWQYLQHPLLALQRYPRILKQNRQSIPYCRARYSKRPCPRPAGFLSPYLGCNSWSLDLVKTVTCSWLKASHVSHCVQFGLIQS